MGGFYFGALINGAANEECTQGDFVCAYTSVFLQGLSLRVRLKGHMAT